MQPVNVMTPTTKLHEEVVSYANRNLAACESSHTEVNQIMIRMRNIVDKLWSGARPEMYGSRSTGLYLATSDVDVVLTGLPMPTSPSDAKRSVPEKLTRLHAELEKEEWVKSTHLVLSARIPVLKARARPARPRRHCPPPPPRPSRPSSALPSSALFSLTPPPPPPYSSSRRAASRSTSRSPRRRSTPASSPATS